ncbi:MAG: alkaline phosphatase, partial [Acidobacteria bacterium]
MAWLPACARPSNESVAQRPARNVILFLADGTGISTVHAASIHGHGAAQKLYIQHMPHLGFSETSSASTWVTDSAAGMTAIVTGEKTHNGVISQGPDAVRGKQDGRPLKSILEYAEEK